MKKYFKIELEDDKTITGGISFVGETVKDFLESTGTDYDINTLDDLNNMLKECGIRQIKEF